MMGDYQVRFCERLRGESPLCLLGVEKVAYPRKHLSVVVNFYLGVSKNKTPLSKAYASFFFSASIYKFQAEEQAS